jgi:hypothetical protein
MMPDGASGDAVLEQGSQILAQRRGDRLAEWRVATEMK